MEQNREPPNKPVHVWSLIFHKDGKNTQVSWHWSGNRFLNVTPKARATKIRINKWDYIKLRSLCTTKETVNGVKRQSMEWEKILANHLSDKGLISKKCKELLELNSKKKSTITCLINELRTWIDISPKKTYKWPASIWEDAQHH